MGVLSIKKKKKVDCDDMLHIAYVQTSDRIKEAAKVMRKDLRCVPNLYARNTCREYKLSFVSHIIILFLLCHKLVFVFCFFTVLEV